MEVKAILAEDTFEIRHYVLRPDQSFEASKYAGDNDADTFHVGGFLDGELTTVASVYKESHPKFPNKLQYRLRGMATIHAHQRKGYAKYLIEFILAELDKRKADLFWFNARRNAFPFYEKLGFKYFGDTFEIDEIGPHKIMFKEITLGNAAEEID